ncbi:hypothetical protein BC829DRAFT_437274 [Chytridium lagenaria]|nr:hypothetical protein BC829DRAFT_437274 [Chytridium lagenaria]
MAVPSCFAIITTTYPFQTANNPTLQRPLLNFFPHPMASIFRSHIVSKLALLTSQTEDAIRPIVERARFAKGARITVSLSAIFSLGSNRRGHRFRIPRPMGLEEEEIQELEEEEEEEVDAAPKNRRKGKKADVVMTQLEKDTKAELFLRCKEVSEKWEKDEYVDCVEAEGRCLSFCLNKERLFREIILQVAREGEQYGRDDIINSLTRKPEMDADVNLLASLESCQEAVVEYELPGYGNRFEASHLRGIFSAAFVVRSLRLAKTKVRSSCRIRVWSVDTGLVLAEYEMSGDKELLLADPLRYLTTLLARANSRISGESETTTPAASTSDVTFGDKAVDIERRALDILAELASGQKGVAYRLFNQVHTEWQRGMKQVLEKYGAGDVLDVETDEYENGLLTKDGKDTLILTKVLQPLQSGHVEAPLLKPRLSTRRKSIRGRSNMSLAVNGEESDPDSVFDDLDDDEDESSALKGPIDLKDGLALDLRLGRLETDATIPEDDGYSSPYRWIHLATNHLRTISGKSSMVFPDEGEPIDDTWDPRTASESNYTKVTGRDAKRVKDCIFDWGRIVDDKRDVGLYLQYAHARLCGIQRRSGVPIPFPDTILDDGLDDTAMTEFEKADLSLLARTPSAVDLASVIAQIPKAMGAATSTLDASAFVPFLVSLARQISSGHNSMFVKGSPENVARARMALLWAARVVISGGLKMMGLTPMQKM